MQGRFAGVKRIGRINEVTERRISTVFLFFSITKNSYCFSLIIVCRNVKSQMLAAGYIFGSQTPKTTGILRVYVCKVRAALFSLIAQFNHAKLDNELDFR